jgi:signal peptidase I
MKRENKIEGLQISQLEAELKREKHKHRYRTVLKSTISTLIVVAAVAVLAATLWMPVLQIYGNSMTPTLKEGQIVVSLKGSNLEQGDLVAFYVGNKLLVKRVIAESGEWFDITEEGVVFVNGKELDEPYLQEKAFGECDIELPYQVPESRYFLMGDHRTSSVDSRSSVIGCIDKEQIVGKIVFCVWPPEDFGVCK